MSILGLLNQTGTLYPKTSYNAQGREVVGTAVSVQCRIEPKRKTKFKGTGEVEVIDAVGFFPSTTSINIDDRFDLGSDKYKVSAKYPVPDSRGNTSHIQVELMLWQKT